MQNDLKLDKEAIKSIKFLFITQLKYMYKKFDNETVNEWIEINRIEMNKLGIANTSINSWIIEGKLAD